MIIERYIFAAVIVYALFIVSCSDDDVVEITFEDQSFSIEENSPPGTLVGRLFIQEASEVKITYRIEGGNEEVFFLINAQGEIRLSELAMIDFETKSVFSLIVEASSEYSNREAKVTILVIDVIEPILRPLTQNEIQTIDYFKEIALGFEFGGASRITRKWRDTMFVRVSGSPLPWMQEELEGIIDEIQELITDGFVICLTNKIQKSNMSVFFGSGQEYANIHTPARQYIGSNWGLFFLFWDQDSYLNRGTMYVDTERSNEATVKHLLREEFTQSLGLARDSERYHNSIFQASWTTVDDYLPIDRDLIRLLYHPKMVPGLNQTEVEQTISSIFREE